jgi:hypothetical protein
MFARRPFGVTVGVAGARWFAGVTVNTAANAAGVAVGWWHT